MQKATAFRAMQPEYKDAVNRCDTSVRVVGPRAHISRTKDRFFSDQVFNSFDDAPWKRLLPTLENLGSGARCGHLPVYFIPETAYAYAWKIHAELNNISILKFFFVFFKFYNFFSYKLLNYSFFKLEFYFYRFFFSFFYIIALLCPNSWYISRQQKSD